jgi:hypothetical protein
MTNQPPPQDPATSIGHADDEKEATGPWLIFHRAWRCVGLKGLYHWASCGLLDQAASSTDAMNRDNCSSR